LSNGVLRFKSSSEIKWYLYRSDAKLRMLFEQVAHAGEAKKSIEWKVSGGVGSYSRKVETAQAADPDDMLKTLIQELENAGQVGTVYEPNAYIKGIMPMRWGMYNDSGFRKPDNGPLVYFGGLDQEQCMLLGLGGSSKHVMGNEGAASTHSRSCTPALVTALLRGIETGQPEPPPTEDPRAGEDEVYNAMAIAQHYLRPPSQNLEYFAKTLMVGRALGCEHFIGVPNVRAVLATPLYVALAGPYPNDDYWGVLPD
jgi:hypothetical protein